jgi:type VI secretion system protein ImpB
MTDNSQHKIGQTRPPRVQITYDVMVGNATEHKELPFVVGIMADLSGMRETEPPAVKDRSFVGIYADNFNDIMAHIRPNLSIAVENRLLNTKGKFKADLVFESMDDFLPMNLIKQIPTLTSLWESRVNLKDLLSKMDGNDDLEEMFLEIMNDTKKQDVIMKAILAEESGEVKNEKPDEDEKLAIETLKALPDLGSEASVPTETFESPYEDPTTPETQK